VTNLNEITFYDDANDQWAADHEYATRAARYAEWRTHEAWAASRELWLRRQGWLRECVRATGEQISVRLVPAIKAMGVSMEQAAEAFRRLARTIPKEQT
jgi:hypothetical protein